MNTAPVRHVAVLLVRDGTLLLVHRLKDEGRGEWDKLEAPGGVLNTDDESREQCITREMKRIGVLPGPRGLENVGTITLHVSNRTETLEVWRGDDYVGTPRNTAELMPETHALDRLPRDRMTKIDRTWIPLVLVSDRFLHWRIKYDPTDDRIVDSTSERQMIFHRIPDIHRL